MVLLYKDGIIDAKHETAGRRRILSHEQIWPPISGLLSSQSCHLSPKIRDTSFGVPKKI
jgi:hypothetical protein